MAHFSRQKRQSKFYWAELGFMALGLLGLQPSLFTNLILGSQTKSTSYKEPYYQATLYQPFESYRDGTPGQLAYHPPSSYSQQPLYSQPYSTQQHSTQPYGTQSYGTQAYGTLPYNTQTYGTQPLYAQQSTNGAGAAFSHQQNYLPPTAYPQPYSPSSYQTASNSWANQPTYLAQANTGYSTPGAAANSNWLGMQSNSYGNNPGNYQPNTNYPSNLYPTITNSKASAYPYNAYAPRSAQPQTFGNNTSYYNSAPTNYAASTPSYLNPSQPATSNSWQRYQAPGPLYR